MRQTFYIAVLLTSSMLGLPQSITFGPISANGVLTTLYGIIVAILLVAERRRVRTSAKLIRPLALLLGWDVLSWLRHRPSKQGFNETLGLGIFVGLIVLLAVRGERDFRQPEVEKFLGWAVALSAGLYAISLLLGGPGTDSILMPRGFAIFALLGVSWCAAGWAFGLDSPSLKTSVTATPGAFVNTKRW